MAEYLRADKLVRPGCKADFGGLIPPEAVTRLIERGVLQGKTLRGKTMVLADDARWRIFELGIEPLAFNQNGWCFAAVDAPIDKVLEVLRDVIDVVDVHGASRYTATKWGAATRRKTFGRSTSSSRARPTGRCC